MEFDSDLSGWTIGAIEPLGTWNVQWTEEHGGAAEIYVSGAPAQTSISQATLIAINPGDQLTVNAFHTDMGNFSGWFLQVDGTSVFRNVLTSEGYESLTWTADKYYAPGTLINVYASVWPGSSTTCVDSLVLEITVPGDLDGDGFVGQMDLDAVLMDWGNSPPVLPYTDPSGDGLVSQDDLDTVLNDWGHGIPPVPEPATLSLLTLGGLAVVRRKRR